MDDLVIEKGIPIPQDVQRPGPRRKYPLADMEVDDSFEVEATKLRSVRTVVSKYLKDNPDKEFFVHQQDNGKIRVWRTK